MRLLITFLLVCAFFGAGAQSFDSTKLYRSLDYGWQYKRVKIDSILKLPNGVIINRSWEFPVTDTSSISSRINYRVRYSDTAAMLLPYYWASNPASYITAAAITGKVNVSDTATMLSGYQSAIGLKAAKATTLTINGTGFDLSANRSWTIPTTDTTSLSNRINTKQNIITNPISGTGTSGQVAYWNGTSTQTGSATLTYTPTSTFLINNSVTAASGIARGKYQTSTLIAAANSDTLVSTDLKGTFTNGAFTGVQNYGLRTQVSSATGSYNIYSSGTAANYFNGRILLGSNVDDGVNKLQVNGSAKISLDANINTITVGLGFSSISTNTAIGKSALAANTTGNTNTAMSYESLKANTVGGANTAVGYSSLISNVDGTNNTAYGQQSLRSNISGNQNVAIGSESLKANTNSNNTAVGYNSLYYNVGASNNSALGHQSLYNTTSGGNNVGIGVRSLFGNTVGANNTAIGYFSGNQIADGFTFATNSSYSTFIGYGTKPLADNQNNQTILGYNQTGLGSNTTIIGGVGNVLTALVGSVLIGTTTAVTSTILALNSTTTGFLPPKMTTTQKLAIATPAEGLMVYDLTLHKLCVYTGSAWETITSL